MTSPLGNVVIVSKEVVPYTIVNVSSIIYGGYLLQLVVQNPFKHLYIIEANMLYFPSV